MTTIQELRESEHIEEIRRESLYEWSDQEYWIATPNHESYNTQEGVKFLCGIDFRRERSNGDLVVKKTYRQ